MLSQAFKGVVLGESLNPDNPTNAAYANLKMKYYNWYAGPQGDWVVCTRRPNEVRRNKVVKARCEDTSCLCGASDVQTVVWTGASLRQRMMPMCLKVSWTITDYYRKWYAPNSVKQLSGREVHLSDAMHRSLWAWQQRVEKVEVSSSWGEEREWEAVWCWWMN